MAAPMTIIGLTTEENALKHVLANPATDDQYYLFVDASRYGTHCVVALVHEKFNKYMIAGLVKEIDTYRLTKEEVAGCRGGSCFYEGYSKSRVGKNVYVTCYGY